MCFSIQGSQTLTFLQVLTKSFLQWCDMDSNFPYTNFSCEWFCSLASEKGYWYLHDGCFFPPFVLSIVLLRITSNFEPMVDSLISLLLSTCILFYFPIFFKRTQQEKDGVEHQEPIQFKVIIIFLVLPKISPSHQIQSKM